MRDVSVIGVGMHPFGKFPDKSLKELGFKAIWAALKDADIKPQEIEAAYVGNAFGGLTTEQESVRGQVILRYSGFSGLPVINLENACASGSTALREAWISVAAGIYDVVLVLGIEKLFIGNTAKSLQALATATDVETMGKSGFQFTGLYAMAIKEYMDTYGATREHLAKVVVKNSHNGSLNPYAQYQRPLTEEKVLGGKVIAEPLTLYMCSGMADGAAAIILCSSQIARRNTNQPVWIIGSNLKSGQVKNYMSPIPQSSIANVAAECYEQAGVGPEDMDVVEVHDAVAPMEFKHCEDLGLCAPGEGFLMVEEGATEINGRIPVNPSGGLTSRGHPAGATGVAQIVEVTWQLRGQAGKRQIQKNGSYPKVGLCLNTGGRIEDDRAAVCVHILSR